MWNFKAIASVPLLGRRWTLTNVLLYRNAIIAKKPQAVLREDRITMRYDDAEVVLYRPAERNAADRPAGRGFSAAQGLPSRPDRPLRRSLKVASGKFAARARLEIALESDGFRLGVESGGGFYAPRFVLGGV